MTTDELITLGEFCEITRSSPHWERLIQEVEKAAIQNILTSAPGDTKTREQEYFLIQGLNGFIGFMDQLVHEKDKLLNPENSEEE